jgi:hypothetical protein
MIDQKTNPNHCSGFDVRAEIGDDMYSYIVPTSSSMHGAVHGSAVKSSIREKKLKKVF